MLWRAWVLLVCVLAMASACGGGDDGGTIPQGLTAAFSPSSTPSAPNLVSLRSGSRAGDTITLEVVVGGPTSSTDLYSFAFSLVLGNAAVAQYVDDSAAVGNALSLTGPQTASVQAGLSGNNLVVGVTKLGGGSGNGLTAGQSVVVRLTFRVLAQGACSVRLSGSNSPAAALDSDGAVVSSIGFDSQSATILGQ